MAPFNSAHFERKVKLVFSFCTANLGVKAFEGVVVVGVGVISGASGSEIGIEGGFWYAMELSL